jgi:hypothetical protein
MLTLAINRLWGGFDVALGGLARGFCIVHSAFHLWSGLVCDWVA